MKTRRLSSGPCKGLIHWCPGCKEPHAIWYERPPGDARPTWQWNGDRDVPTFSPSILISIMDDEDDHGNPLPQPVVKTTCHYFIVHGQINFCGDSAHALAGQTVPLPDWPYAEGQFGGVEPE